MDEGTLLPNHAEIKKILREYYEELHINKLDNLDKVVKFLEKQTIKIDVSRNRISVQTCNKERDKVSNEKISKKEKPRTGLH